WATAARLLQDSLRLNEEYTNPLGSAETHREIGKLHAAWGHTTEARASFESALSGFRKLGAQTDAAEVERLLDTIGT
ncbi:MAG: hypothetical protein HY710_07320, partial [Candidatus Latescibacteria bacterium]|nr:hypothetical protein [Candidatus Latescibacterota bacterium]